MEFVQPIREKSKLADLARALRNDNVRNYALLAMGVYSGLRISDLLGLRVGDVLAGSGARVQIAKVLEVREQKTRKAKRFPLNDRARRALSQYLRTRGKPDPDEPLFMSRQRDDMGERRPLSRSQAWRVLSGAAHRVGISDRIGSHTLRKTFGYHQYLAGTDITRVQKMLNHSSPAETLRYIGITQDELDKCYLDLDLC